MILINLLPPELKNRQYKIIPSISPLVIPLVFLVVCLTFWSYIVYQSGRQEVKILESRWESMTNDLRRVAQLKQDIEEKYKIERALLEKSVAPAFPNTAFLTETSALLPMTIWFLELKISRMEADNSFLLKGLSLPGKQNSSIQEVENYLRDLKEKLPEKAELSLTTTRQRSEGAELTLFTAIYTWK